MAPCVRASGNASALVSQWYVCLIASGKNSGTAPMSDSGGAGGAIRGRVAKGEQQWRNRIVGEGEQVASQFIACLRETNETD